MFRNQSNNSQLLAIVTIQYSSIVHYSRLKGIKMKKMSISKNQSNSTHCHLLVLVGRHCWMFPIVILAMYVTIWQSFCASIHYHIALTLTWPYSFVLLNSISIWLVKILCVLLFVCCCITNTITSWRSTVLYVSWINTLWMTSSYWTSFFYLHIYVIICNRYIKKQKRFSPSIS